MMHLFGAAPGVRHRLHARRAKQRGPSGHKAPAAPVVERTFTPYVPPVKPAVGLLGKARRFLGRLMGHT